MSAKIEISSDGSRTRLLVDGEDIAHRLSSDVGISFEIGRDQVPVVRVGLVGTVIARYEGTLRLSDEDRELLTKLGWTPPDGES